MAQVPVEDSMVWVLPHGFFWRLFFVIRAWSRQNLARPLVFVAAGTLRAMAALGGCGHSALPLYGQKVAADRKSPETSLACFQSLDLA